MFLELIVQGGSYMITIHKNLKDLKNINEFFPKIKTLETPKLPY
jgi:hypothetical protein